ncbi:MAG: hypothetical protein ACM3PY_04295 [Omnitrophica WOR_2 bacterium]
MAQSNQAGNGRQNDPGDYRSDNLKDSEMMAHLIDAMNSGTDVGHYGRLVFVMVSRYFMNEEEVFDMLNKQPGMSEEEARALILQVDQKDYNPPKRERILEWQSMQDFQICPNPEDPNGCNVYKDLKFPQEIYDRIGEFWVEKAESQD